ncbi:MAG: GAF domain-containing protein [Verrucomicrobiota bacterium]|nr:GAF domain-containing protein [Verrucomicrobiota bacterium]
MRKIRELLVTGCRELGLENGIFARVDGDRYAVEHFAPEANAALEGLVCCLQDTICHEVLLRDEPVAFEHAAASEWRHHPGYLKYKGEAYLGAPVRAANKVYGALCFTSSQPRAEKFTPGDIEFLRLIVQWVGGEVERQQTEAALSESKLFAESIAENSTSFIYIHDLESKKNVYANRNVAQFLGYSPAQTSAMGEQFLASILHPEDLPRVMQHSENFGQMHEGDVIDIEYRVRNAAGAWHSM